MQAPSAPPVDHAGGQQLTLSTPGWAKKNPGRDASASSQGKRKQRDGEVEVVQASDDPIDVVQSRLARVESKIEALSSQLTQFMQHLTSHERRTCSSERPHEPSPGSTHANARDFPPVGSAADQKKQCPRLTTVWGRQLNDAVKSAGVMDKLIYKPAPPKASPSRSDTLIVLGIAESKSTTWQQRKADDMRAIHDVLQAIGTNIDNILGIHRLSPSKDISSEALRSRPMPIRVFMSSDTAVAEALRRAPSLKATVFCSVFLRRDLSKEDRELDRSARLARDEQNKLFAENNVENVKCIVPNRGKVGRLLLVNNEKKRVSELTSSTSVPCASSTAPASSSSSSSTSAPQTASSSTTAALASVSTATKTSSASQNVKSTTATSNEQPKTTSSNRARTQSTSASITNLQQDKRSSSRLRLDTSSQATSANSALEKEWQLATGSRKGGITKKEYGDIVSQCQILMAKVASLEQQLEKQLASVDRPAQEAMDVTNAATTADIELSSQ